jgi:cytochrome P450
MKQEDLPGGQPYDLFSRQFKSDPFPTFAQMRAERPVYAHRTPDGTTIWYITRYEDVLEVLRDDDHFCKDPRNAGLAGGSVAASRRTTAHQLVNENMLFSDPPDHTRLRALVSQAFTPQRVEKLTGFVESTAHQLLDRFRQEGHVELIDAYALPLPVYVIGRLLGIPDSDRERVALWSQAIISPGSRNLNYSARKQRVKALIRYLQDMFALRLAQPRDDLISALVHAEESGDRLNEAELSSMVALLLVTGHETTVNLIGNGALSLLQHPHQLEQIRTNPELWDSAIEELLRFDGPVETSTSRWASRDVMIGGQQIRRGHLVRVVLTSANRDEQRFEQSNQLLVNRSDNKHLAFGYGIHYCLGAPLARLEGKTALRLLFDALPGLQLGTSADQIQWRSGVLFRGLQRLDVRWETGTLDAGGLSLQPITG